MPTASVQKIGKGWDAIQFLGFFGLCAGLIFTCAYWTDPRLGDVDQRALNSAMIAVGSFLVLLCGRLGAWWSRG